MSAKKFYIKVRAEGFGPRLSFSKELKMTFWEFSEKLQDWLNDLSKEE